jgi:tetratricopeptide (TPR) repeat protein
MDSLNTSKPQRKRGVVLTPEAHALFQRTLTNWWLTEGHSGRPSREEIADKLNISVQTIHRIFHGIGVDKHSLQLAFARLQIPWTDACCTPSAIEGNGAALSARHLLTESISLLEAAHDSYSQADVLAAVANVALHEGKFDLVEDYNKLRLAIYQQRGDTANAVRMRLNLKTAQMWRTRAGLQNDLADIRVQAEKLGDKALIAETIFQEGSARFEQEGLLAALPSVEASIALYESLDHKIGIAGCNAFLAGLYFEAGRYQESEALTRYCLTLYTQTGCLLDIGWSLCALGNISRGQGDYRQAQDYYEQGEAMMQQIASVGGVAHLRNCQGDTWRRLGNLRLARKLCSECLEVYSQLKAKLGIGSSLLKLGYIALAENDPEQAVQHFHDSVVIHLELGLKRSTIPGLEALACGLALTGDDERAALLFGGCEALRQRMHTVMPPSEREGYKAARGNVERHLGRERFADIWTKGGSLVWEKIVSLVIAR